MLNKFCVWSLAAIVLLAGSTFLSTYAFADEDQTTPTKTDADDKADDDDQKAADDDKQADDKADEKNDEAGDGTDPSSETMVEPEDDPTVTRVLITDNFIVNNLWIMIAGMLVFIMHLGFATLESGLTRSKNTVNILFKNTMIVCIGLIMYGVCGFNLMYPGYDSEADVEYTSSAGDKLDAEGFGALDKKAQEAYTKADVYEDTGIFQFAGFGFLSNGNDLVNTETADAAGGEVLEAYNANSTPEYHASYTIFTDFFFQAMFAATCCTIVSGAVAGRIKLGTFLVFATLFVSLSYPITGSWHWGGGWLARAGFYDFAGSTLVHSVGGWAALVMATMLGARKGKYVDGRVNAMPASNMPLAAIGVFLLWFGWFGFNGGSVLSADPGLVSLVLVTTSMAAAAGGVSAALISTIHGGKPDLSMALNGILAGLVGITAGADQMSGLNAITIGLIAGVLVYFAVIFIDSKLKIDDPVGAISVHLVCGIFGTLAVGIFGASAGIDQLIAQVKGILAIGGFTVIFSIALGLALKATMGLRVDEEEEEKGLDIGEHGMQAYTM